MTRQGTVSHVILEKASNVSGLYPLVFKWPLLGTMPRYMRGLVLGRLQDRIVNPVIRLKSET